jgi:DNA-binding transcriptional MerR regulator/methylmalonyl-CoA mutase cobalamin-binding subunit
VSAPLARSAPRYPIRAVSKLTGISVDTLRAWERRYGAVVPSRGDRGRLYTDADVTRLQLLHRAVEAGHSVGAIAALSDRDLRDLGTPVRAVSAEETRPVDTSAVKAALLTLDSASVDREVSRLAAVLSPIELVRDALLPVLRDVGDNWNAHRGGIALEHMMSSTIQHLFGSFVRLYGRRSGAARLLFATPAGDHHEIGILAAAMLAAARGLAVSYVGPNLPAGDIVAAIRAANARVLVLGLTYSTSVIIRDQDLGTILEAMPPDVELWLGGRDARRYEALVGARGIVLADFDAYVAELGRLEARAH